MTLTAGVITLQSVQASTAQLVTTAASGGTGPYTQQWYRSTTTGFTPGGGNILTGQTALTLSDSGLIPNTIYYYKVVFTDTGNSNTTVTATQLAVTTSAPTLSPNQFGQSPFLGTLDLSVGPTNVFSVQIDVTQATPLYAGSAVKFVNNGNGIPTVVGCTADSDQVYGFIKYDIKTQAFTAGKMAEIAAAGSCIFLYASTVITRGYQVVLDLVSQGTVQDAAGQTGDNIVGWAFDQASAYGQLIRVMLRTPSFQVV